jgi:hypothetical protein
MAPLALDERRPLHPWGRSSQHPTALGPLGPRANYTGQGHTAGAVCGPAQAIEQFLFARPARKTHPRGRAPAALPGLRALAAARASALLGLGGRLGRSLPTAALLGRSRPRPRVGAAGRATGPHRPTTGPAFFFALACYAGHGRTCSPGSGGAALAAMGATRGGRHTPPPTPRGRALPGALARPPPCLTAAACPLPPSARLGAPLLRAPVVAGLPSRVGAFFGQGGQSGPWHFVPFSFSFQTRAKPGEEARGKPGRSFSSCRRHAARVYAHPHGQSDLRPRSQ